MWLATGVERLGIQQTTPLRLHPQSIWVLPGAIWYAQGLDLPRRSLQDDLPQWLDRFSPADHLVQDAVLRLVGGQARAAPSRVRHAHHLGRAMVADRRAPLSRASGGRSPSVRFAGGRHPGDPGIHCRACTRAPRAAHRPRSARIQPGHPLGLGKRRRCWNRGCFRAGRPAASSRADLLALPHNPDFQPGRTGLPR